MTQRKKKRKKIVKQPKRKLKTIEVKSNGDYPFINPIIVTSDNKIVDGEYRFAECKKMGLPVKYQTMTFSSKDVKKEEFIHQLNQIQQEQKQKLENWFLKYKVGYKDQLIQCSSADRMELFFKFEYLMKSDQEYWKTLGECYVHSNNNYRHRHSIKKAFCSKRANRNNLMSTENLGFFSRLPDQVKIYRGMSEDESKGGEYGVSWSLQEEIGKKFANDYIHNYDTRQLCFLVKELTIAKSEIIAYFGDRQEDEIIYVSGN